MFISRAITTSPVTD